MCADPFITMRICHMFSCRELHAEGEGSFDQHATERWHSYDYNIDCDDAY